MCPMANAMVSRVSPNANATPAKPMPRPGAPRLPAWTSVGGDIRNTRVGHHLVQPGHVFIFELLHSSQAGFQLRGRLVDILQLTRGGRARITIDGSHQPADFLIARRRGVLDRWPRASELALTLDFKSAGHLLHLDQQVVRSLLDVVGDLGGGWPLPAIRQGSERSADREDFPAAFIRLARHGV